MNAALYQEPDENTVWIVERSGYEAGGVDTAKIEASVGPGRILWLTPEISLSSLMNREFTDGSIQSLTFYSHGLPGLVALRYGWGDKGMINYGLSISQVQGFSKSKFTTDAKIQFDSCNTATATSDGNLAQEMAYTTGLPVQGWTGRTSYAEINDGPDDEDKDVHGSQVRRNGRTDFKEVASRFIGRIPNLTAYTFANRKSGFTAEFSVLVRLPESRRFTVSANGSVVVKFTSCSFEHPNRASRAEDRIGIRLHRSIAWGFDETIGHETVSATGNDIAAWSALQAGAYYLEITVESRPVNDYETMVGEIDVEIYD